VTIETPRPEYLQIAAILRREIQVGEFPPGSVLPSEPALAERFGTTRATVNRALAVLRTEGLVRPERGRGTTVQPLPVIRREAVARQRRDIRVAGGARGAFEGELRRLGLAARSDVDVYRVPALADVARLLAVEEGATVLARRREMYARDIPVQLATSYLPMDIAEGTLLAEADTGPGGMYSRLAELGFAPADFNESIRVRPPEDTEARFLLMDPDQRVLAIRRTAQTAEGRVIEVNDIVLPAHQWELNYKWRAEPDAQP
jgi:GntR family transcriptional regulator